ncbi:MAG: AlkA N-terminal domain-containing protein [Burkholderiales bacterium]
MTKSEPPAAPIAAKRLAVARGPRLSCAFDLPAGFRAADILAFHRRDAQQVSERVDDQRLEKALNWDGRAALLTIGFEPGRALADLAVDGGSARDLKRTQPSFDRMVRRMLGLTQPIDEFEHALARHPQLGPLIARQAGLRVPLSATPFEALAWAIAGQQISLSAALSLRRKMIVATGLTHSSGLACHPDATAVARLTEPDLRAAGFSQTKARTLLAVATQVCDGRLPLTEWTDAAGAGALAEADIRERLLRIPGIGPWTIDYALLRGFGWLDGSLHGDVAVRRRLQELLGENEKISEKRTRLWLAEFTPWRALVAAHLWASKTSTMPVQARANPSAADAS